MADLATSVDTLALPARAYLPGDDLRAYEAVLARAKSQASDVTLSAQACDNIAWLYGLKLIAHGFHWEAHEVLEVVWMRAAPNSRERTMVQGMIQLANARLKLRMARPRAALRLCVIAEACFAEAGLADEADVMGLSPRAAMAESRELATELEPSR